MAEPTDEQFAAAWNAFYAQAVATDSFPLAVDMGRQMLAALEAHGCIPKPQGLTVRQELVARLRVSGMFHSAAVEAADQILALGDAK